MKLKKNVLIGFLLLITMLLVACGSSEDSTSEGAISSNGDGNDEIKIGLLVAMSGSAAPLGPPTLNAAELAIHEINESGGVLGKKLTLVVGETATDPKTANDRAKSLIGRENVSAIFSQLTSAEREAVLPEINKADLLYFYNNLYEGGGCAPNMYLNGEVPGHITPVISHIIEEYDASNWYIVGNDYVWPHKTSEVLKKVLDEHNGQVVGEDYVPMGTTDFSSVLSKIEQSQPDIISLQMIGDSIGFMKQFHQRGLHENTKVLALAVDENMVDTMGEAAVGMLKAAAYFLDYDSESNQQFLMSHDEIIGGQDKQNFASVPTYDAIHMWAMAVNQANTLETEKVKEQLNQISFTGPRGTISYEADSQHAELPIYLGEVQEDGKFKVIKDFGMVPSGEQCN